MSLPAQIYLVTTTTVTREPLFAEFPLGCVAARALTSPHLWRDASLLCWVLMPDHFHGLIELGSRESLSALIKRLKGNVARSVNAARQEEGSIWDPSFHDHALRAEEDVRAGARYVIGNPVRAGLVERAGDYPFWDAIWIGADRL